MNAKHGQTTWSRKTGPSSVQIAQGTLDNLKSPRDEVHTGPSSLLIRDAHIWIKNDIIRGSIIIQDGRIQKIARRIPERADEEILARRLVALPGLIDAHVHLRHLRLSYKDDFTSGTAAAADGGFTTVLDMPNTLPPTDSAKRLIEKQKVATQKTYVNVGFHAAAVSDAQAIESLAGAGAFSLKLYLPKPIAPLEVQIDQVIEKMMRAAGRVDMPVTVHAEDLATPENSNQLDSFE